MFDKISLDQIVKQMDSFATLDDNLRVVMTEFIDDYVNEMLRISCELARHRGSNQLESKDVNFAIEHYLSDRPSNYSSSSSEMWNKMKTK